MKKIKAYIVNPRCIPHNHEAVTDNYLSHEYGETEREARMKLLSMCINNGLHEDVNGDDLSYINLRTKRFPELDKLLIDGKYKTQSEVDYENRVQENKEMLTKMLGDNPNSYAYIRKGGYYYCPNRCGYTERQTEAGVYTIKEAVRECLGMDLRDYMRPELINIDAHNKIIMQKIVALQSRLL